MQSESTGTFGGDAEDRSPEEIERAIAGTRAAIEDTVEELGERLRPAQMAEDARSFVREKAVRGANDAWNSAVGVVREYPIPVALVGGGLAVLLGVRHGHGRASELERARRSFHLPNGRSAMAAWLGGAGERAGTAGARVAERGAQVAERARALLDSDSGARAQKQAEQVRESLEALLREQPLLLGIAGFALGALLARSR